MKSFSLLSMVAVGVAQVDEQTNLLQTKTMQTLQQRSAEAEDCYVTGGCVTTTEAPTTTTEAPTTTTTAAPATTQRPTRPRPTRPPPTTEAPTTEATTEAPPPTTEPDFGEVVVDKPNPKSETTQSKYCEETGATFKNENLRTAKVNNLGGQGPGGRGEGRWAGEEVIAYECGIELPDGKCVDVVISAVGTTYKDKHSGRMFTQERTAAERHFRRSSKDFIGAYNGDKRANVVGIGALVAGEYTFKFSFYGEDKAPVVIDYLPMTFYDLDGKADLRGDLRYEVASTMDAEGLVAFKHPTLRGVDNLKHGCVDGKCTVESVTQEVEIPDNFDRLDKNEKSAAATFLFAHKSSVEINYKLNYGHRVFLFKGSKSLFCAETEETTKKPTSRFGGRFGGRR